MIIIKITSGLGNQLFQYAAARRLALKYNVDLKLDIDGFSRNNLRTYELDKFNINAELVTWKDLFKIYPAEAINRFIIRKIFGKRISYKINNLIERKFKSNYFKYNPNNKTSVPLLYNNKLAQRYFHFDPEILNIKDNIYLIGFFQSEKFFVDVAKDIRSEFKFKTEAKGVNKQNLDSIKKENSVSIHIRRGDYVQDENVNKLFGTCTLDYYYKAINYILEQSDSCVFYVFSDDIEWAKKNLKIKFPTVFVSNNSENAIEDLRLMSNCKHNILANSSFSWWSAWLNQNNNKIVIAPKKWVQMQNYNTKDLLPDTWLKM